MPTLLYTKAFKIYSCVSGFIVIYTNKKHAIPKCPAFKTLVAFLKSEFTFFLCVRDFFVTCTEKTRAKKVTLQKYLRYDILPDNNIRYCIYLFLLTTL